MHFTFGTPKTRRLSKLEQCSTLGGAKKRSTTPPNHPQRRAKQEASLTASPQPASNPHSASLPSKTTPTAEISSHSCGDDRGGGRLSEVERVADGVAAPPVKERSRPTTGLSGVGIGVWQVSGQADEAKLRQSGARPLAHQPAGQSAAHGPFGEWHAPSTASQGPQAR